MLPKLYIVFKENVLVYMSSSIIFFHTGFKQIIKLNTSGVDRVREK